MNTVFRNVNFLLRHPYRAESVTECCMDMNLYDSSSHYCCADGSVRKQCDEYYHYEDWAANYQP